MDAKLDSTFSALADPIRRTILARLARGEATVTELARPFDVSLPAISRHLRVLEEAGLLERTKVGRVHRCRLREQPLREAQEWIAGHRASREDRPHPLHRHAEGKPDGE